MRARSRAGSKRPDIRCFPARFAPLGAGSRVHAVGDGAPWIVGQVEEQFGDQGRYLIDFYHVASASVRSTTRGARMTFHRDVVGAIGRTPLVRLAAASEATGCTILGKAEFINPGGSVKDRAALAIIQDAVARGALRPGGVDRRGDRRQHRHRHRHGGVRALGYRSVIVIPDTQIAGEEGPASPRRRRADRSAGGSVRQSQQLRPLFRPARRSARQDRAGRRDLGQPVRQRRQPARPLRDDGSGDLRRSRRQGGRLRQRGRHGRHARGRRHGAQGAQPRHQDRARRPDGRGALFLLHDRRAQESRARRSPRASARVG